MNIFLKICKYLNCTLKNNCQKENSAWFNIFLKPPKWDNIGFSHGEGKNYYFFIFSSVVAFKQTKGPILLQVQNLKNVLKNTLLLLILGLQATFSEALQPKSRPL